MSRPGGLLPVSLVGHGLGLRSRIALLCAVGVGLSVALAALAGFVVVHHELTVQSDTSLLDRAEGLSMGLLPEEPLLLPGLSVAAVGAADLRIGVLEADTAYYASPGFDWRPGPPEQAVAVGLVPESIRTVSVGGVDYRVAAVHTPDANAIILVRSLADQERVQSDLAVASTLIGAAGVVLAAAAGFSVARAALAPVQRLTAAAEYVTRTTELVPIPVPPGPPRDELARLATAFNGMLAALATARESERRLVADAGHELRTPLTSMRTNLDLLVQADRAEADPSGPRLSATDRAEILADLHAQTGELADLVGDLVELSRGEVHDAAMFRVDLGEIVERAGDRARRRGPAVGLSVLSTPFDVLADPGTLERAVVNVIDNAIRWTPPGGRVDVRQHDGVVTVDDTGPGFAPQDLPYVFDRFYRAPSARGMPGSGLGLAIVASVASRLGGSVSAGRSPAGGARVTIRVPGIPGGMPAGRSDAPTPGAAGGSRASLGDVSDRSQAGPAGWAP